MRNWLLAVFTLLAFAFETTAQPGRFLVELRHKGAGTRSLSSPSAFLTQRAIDRRVRQQIVIDSADLPVPQVYIDQLASIPGVTILNVSRWLNAVAVQTTDPEAINTIQTLDFVKASRAIAARSAGPSNKITEQWQPAPVARQLKLQGDYFNYGGVALSEINIHEGRFLHNIGLRGQGMQIAMVDAGFFQYTSLRSFDSVNLNNQVLDTWDFVTRDQSVNEDHAHGMQCFSTIAANIPGEFVGTAPKASFHLFRTEDVSSEYPLEEFNLACGVERADSLGADLVSCSLGYGYGFSGGFPDYPYSHLNGNTTISARAVDIGAAKGLLVVVAAGNSGNDYWRRIVTPADADSVLAVGAVNIDLQPGSFSSYGPSADGRVKPDIASVGWGAQVQGTNNTIILSNGTSFACPKIAGLASCLWQAFPERNNMRIVRAIREAGSKYNTPDDRTGYGVPNLKTAFSTLLGEYASSSVLINDCEASLSWTSKDVSSMKYLIYRRLPGAVEFTRLAEVPASAGDQLSPRNYTFTDDLRTQAPGLISYRIRQVIDTNSSSVSFLNIGMDLTVDHSVACPAGSSLIQLAPNPASAGTSIWFNSLEPIAAINISVYDMKGRLLQRIQTVKPGGFYRKEIATGTLASGKYLIRIDDGQKTLATLDLLKL